MSFDLTRYREHKEKGLIKVYRDADNGRVTITGQQFDRFTGTPMDSVSTVMTEEIIKQIELQQKMAEHLAEECKAVLGDVRTPVEGGN